MHGIAIAILNYGYLDDNTALSRYSASCGPDHDSWMSKKKKVVFAARLDPLLQQTCMALFLNIFVVTSNSSVSIYRSICSCSHFFPACYQGTTCGKADHPWQPYLVRGDHLRQHNFPQMVRGPVVAGDRLRRDRLLHACDTCGPFKLWMICTVWLVGYVGHWFSYVLWQFECNGASLWAISPWKLQSSAVTRHFVAPHHHPPSTPV